MEALVDIGCRLPMGPKTMALDPTKPASGAIPRGASKSREVGFPKTMARQPRHGSPTFVGPHQWWCRGGVAKTNVEASPQNGPCGPEWRPRVQTNLSGNQTPPRWALAWCAVDPWNAREKQARGIERAERPSPLGPLSCDRTETKTNAPPPGQTTGAPGGSLRCWPIPATHQNPKPQVDPNHHQKSNGDGGLDPHPNPMC